MNAWLKRCDLNRERVSEPRTLSVGMGTETRYLIGLGAKL